MSALVEGSVDAGQVSSKANSAQEFSVDLLRVYYSRLFPYDTMFKWFSYGNDPSSPTTVQNDKDFYSRREWSFTMEDDIYIRYLSFRNRDEMAEAIQSRQPHKIDIGAVFSACPKDHKALKPDVFHTVERELVFDIDMTDYDDIRSCCKGAEICQRCWPYMTMAIKIVDRSLKEDFGFKHICWIYSGRRGVHCWVSDSVARQLTNEARSAVVEYLMVHTGTGENSDRKMKSPFLAPRHPMIKRAYDILEPLFEKYIVNEEGQGLLGKRERCIKLLNTLPNENIRKELNDLWEKAPSLSGAEKWRQLKAATTMADKVLANKKRVNYGELEAWRYELVFMHCYPRLDANVSKAQNHLLKSPFCVHPKTGRVCVPIHPHEVDVFDPFTVPTVRTLCDEIDRYDREYGEESKGVPDLDKTSLKSTIESFEKMFLRELYKSIRQEMRDRGDLASALNGDF